MARWPATHCHPDALVETGKDWSRNRSFRCGFPASANTGSTALPGLGMATGLPRSVRRSLGVGAGQRPCARPRSSARRRSLNIRRVSPLPRQSRSTRRRPGADAAAIAALLLLLVVGSWDVLRPGAITVGLDSAAFFYPMFSFLGERLRAGEIPGWNPYQFAGAPFAADPESGWTYLPAMVCFAVLPLAAAAKAFAFVHLALAGLGTYALARALRIGPVASLTAGIAFAQSGLFADRLRCCLAYVQVAAWLPVMLLGVELAVRRRWWRRSVPGWALAAFALSQILAAWLGQGAYYALLILGAYVGYRTVVAPPFPVRPAARLAALALHGGAILGLGFALAAAGLLPRLAYHSRSNLADGYAGDLVRAADAPGWPWRRLAEELLGPTGWYVGGSVLALAVAAPLLPTGRRAAPAFAAVAVAALLLAWERATPLHALLFAFLPGFEALHRHAPTRVLPLAALAPALLAGATVDVLARGGGPGRRLAAAAVPALLGVSLIAVGVPIPAPARFTVPAVALALALVAHRPRPGMRTLPLLLASLVFVDLLLGARQNVERGLFASVDLARIDDATGAAAFLRDRPDDPPPRFFGYEPSLRAPFGGETRLYLEQYRDPRARALLVNNRATLLRLPDVQGYNPIQPIRYVELLRAMNGHRQEYHGANVFPAGLDSTLLDLLGARYVVLPADVPARRVDLRGLLAANETVYRDGTVRVVARGEALPRAWIVHEARRVAPGGALPLLAGDAVDPRRVAVLESVPPPLTLPADPAADDATWLAYEPDRLRLRTESDAPGLLVLSEGYDPGWRAEVDGKSAPVLVANHALRAVPLPAGAHTVELRYEPPGLRLGLAITLIGYALLAALLCGRRWGTLGRRARPGTGRVRRVPGG